MKNVVKSFLNDDDIWYNYSCKIKKEKEEEKFKINIRDLNILKTIYL